MSGLYVYRWAICRAPGCVLAEVVPGGFAGDDWREREAAAQRFAAMAAAAPELLAALAEISEFCGRFGDSALARAVKVTADAAIRGAV